MFEPGSSALTLSDVARLTGMTRATARRILLTFESLGYVRSDGRNFSPTTQLLDLSAAYMSCLGVDELARPRMRQLVEEVGEAVSMTALDLPDTVYLARIQTPHILAVPGSVGFRLPATATASGRVLLADLPADELDSFLSTVEIEASTHRTVTDRDALASIIARVATRGWAMVDEELEPGLRAIAAPIRGMDGRVLAALSIASSTSRGTAEDLFDRCLPALQRAADDISRAIGQNGDPPSQSGAKT